VYVNINFHTNPGKVADTVRYVAHREESLPEGRTREIYGVGPRYRELRGDETAIIRRLRGDAEGIRQPHFFRVKFTVDDAIAARLMALPAPYRDWAIRDAVEKTFTGAFARAQGAFVIHYHGGTNRPFGHPHAHAVLSPRLQDGVALQYIPRTRLARIKDRWEREVTQAVSRFERRALLHTADRVPVWALTPRQEPLRRPFGERLLELAARRTATAALGRPSGTLLRTAGHARASRRGPAGILRQLAPRLAESVAPGPLRTALRAVRLWGRLTSGGNGDGSGE
jgi:hypothetical protein